MHKGPIHITDDFDLSFKVYEEMMANRVSEILLVSSPYDAFIMEEDGRLAERIIHEYRGLNLTRPPRLTWVSNAAEALDALAGKRFDLVLTMPRLDDMEPVQFGKKIKETYENLPVFLLTHSAMARKAARIQAVERSIDQTFVWLGNTDLLLAIIKSVEDRMNVAYDTRRARVCVIVLVEDSPMYRSSLLPMLYKEVVSQTNAVMEESLNEEHKILRMRARPKILTAATYEEAWDLYTRYKPYLLAFLSDVRFPRNGEIDPSAGFTLLSEICTDCSNLPMLMLSSEEENRNRAEACGAVFLDKNSPTLHMDIRSFMRTYLGFGDFIFRMPDGSEVARAPNLRAMEKVLPTIPEESILYHAARNHFSSWLMARSEIQLASHLRPVKASDFDSVSEIKTYLAARIRERRKGRQRGVVTDFNPGEFDPDTEFVKIGKGSLGGKARGLAFMTYLLKKTPELAKRHPGVDISVPRTLVISTEGFESMMAENNLKEYISGFDSDGRMEQLFLGARFPAWVREDLALFLRHMEAPLAVRSSSLLEDAQYQARAGVYNTYMIPNNHPDPKVRLGQLINAVKLVYASTYFEKSRSFSRSTQQRTEDDKMAVILQQVTGRRYGKYFYPAISGVAQSYNFYPISYMKPEEGIVHLAFGLGKTVVEGGTALRFSPNYPQFLPQFSTVEDILKNAQRKFYALKTEDYPIELTGRGDGTLARLAIDDDGVRNQGPVRYLAGSYDPQDHRIRDAALPDGHWVLTFANIVKYNDIPLPGIITDILDMGRKGMGCPVEIEFAMNLPEKKGDRPEFTLLQIRPMAISQRNMEVEISEAEVPGALCYSENALGNGVYGEIRDIVYVKPDDFDPGRTMLQADQIGEINRGLARADRKYLLIGPGRWGTADRWLGIPVTWGDISGVGAMVEAAMAQLKADPSQGSHFFNNITSQGIPYITVPEKGNGFIDWDWLASQPAVDETTYLRHVRLEGPLTLKIDGKGTRAVILKPGET